MRPREEIPWKTIRKKVPYEGRTHRSDRAGKTRTALLEMRTAPAKTVRKDFVAKKCFLENKWISQQLHIIIWLAPRAGKINQIARCDWLPERARWSHLVRSGLPAVNPLLTKFVRLRLGP